MTKRTGRLFEYVKQKKHHAYRQVLVPSLADKFNNINISYMQRTAQRLCILLDMEKAIILPDEYITATRTISKIPEVYLSDELKEIRAGHFIHELGRVCNISADYNSVLKDGLLKKREIALDTLAKQKAAGNIQSCESLECSIQTIDAVILFAEKYTKEAKRQKRNDLVEVLEKVPKYGASTFREALQALRIIHFSMWIAGHYHCTLGRFDQYMWPYFINDMEAGRLNYGKAFELLEDFFIALNKDIDLYHSQQLGDNGQSLVLGGCDKNGNDAANILTSMCLEASLELKLIDPKINLRIHSRTEQSLIELGTHLTSVGLGFPQYSNDEIVVPGLVAKGYDLEDARDYVVAACWEFIIPGFGMDIPNIGALSLMKVVEEAVIGHLQKCSTFDELFSIVSTGICAEAGRIMKNVKNILIEPAPFYSVLMKGCLEKGCDISLGAKYNNYGVHGTGIANAADSLAAIKKYVFDEKAILQSELINALEKNYEGYNQLYHLLKFEAPKMGNDDECVDSIAVNLLKVFSSALKECHNERNGIFRAGSGSAMYYIWHAAELGAGPDGRKKGEPLGANFSPALGIKTKGPVSVMKSFAKPNMKEIINGGPLTIEFHTSAFRNTEAITKIAKLVRFYMDIGGQQLQLNAINKETLLEAQEFPDRHKDLIVRVWGWSGYFYQLDKAYQDHVIARTEYGCL
ncbi:MAG: hypothetical protein A2268_12295 [Candidatus Raymondbacteria bacterium RifOxyA12_full_50_37]|uniref:Pyruvate formate-lyase n=1 Tax=Candidatus Raymondbacteria bacterium RIFOXYD12_FULL_49_13 TaxID=1817890 RepID=A0A1F7F8R5_UNCRA|nr:MAG: hypothetical protein A2350_20445 [Candidatus Raymondbacteria bacterium RifOxyB12_full_50_8]OGJ90255.1 MAG: hypothetical protein A2268_12295 [Candidatus Raymondbacteria bacterium RifOxyA12_full_50_37]OGJ91323.1 MAG: hypothetical protein A2248_03790 [Candidatus Raymondbacteria bacterium RIFOXYA2_FULL_49_16]OGJ97772.1 MAG: hypothetical protein A2453_13930 [Candidatus Raymondbacteria bacterium RIFOXYC2_FULL_50_21]OGK02916.1 MAG: hypothetical protein A2519_06190 [Candidatus Raymondbacteria b